MREKSRKRLGRRFELLLGQEHDYGYVDRDLIQRYVCLGDDFEDDGIAHNQGRFADITKSADIYLPSPLVPIRLCIRDTPGVRKLGDHSADLLLNGLPADVKLRLYEFPILGDELALIDGETGLVL